MNKLIVATSIAVVGIASAVFYSAKTIDADKAPGAMPQAASSITKPSGKILALSDIHFNPFYDPEIVDELLSAEYTAWQAIFESSTDSSYGAYGSDTYYRLLSSGLQAMKARNPRPDIIIINGDFLCHDFQDSFEQETGIQNEDTLQAFIRKTTSFVALMLKQHFPDSYMLPVVGNNDDYCGDYHIQPSGSFLSFFAKEFSALMYPTQRRDFLATFSRGGYYKVTMPWDSSQVFIGLNTVFMSPKYSNVCNPADTLDPAKEQLLWLKGVLASCAQQGKKVWFSCHIPPGMDVYASTHTPGPCKLASVGMWDQSHNDFFITLTTKYGPIIKAGLAGHTHMNDFRLLGADSGAITAFMNITPAISPIFGNNPSFQELTWDPATMQLLNIDSYAFKGFEADGQDVWQWEYDYAKTYGVAPLNVPNLTKLWKRIAVDTTVRNKYLRFYYADNPTRSPRPWKAYWCGIRFLTPTGFASCHCN